MFRTCLFHLVLPLVLNVERFDLKFDPLSETMVTNFSGPALKITLLTSAKYWAVWHFFWKGPLNIKGIPFLNFQESSNNKRNISTQQNCVQYSKVNLLTTSFITLLVVVESEVTASIALTMYLFLIDLPFSSNHSDIIEEFFLVQFLRLSL